MYSELCAHWWHLRLNASVELRMLLRLASQTSANFCMKFKGPGVVVLGALLDLALGHSETLAKVPHPSEGLGVLRLFNFFRELQFFRLCQPFEHLQSSLTLLDLLTRGLFNFTVSEPFKELLSIVDSALLGAEGPLRLSLGTGRLWLAHPVT